MGALAAPFQTALIQGSWGQGLKDNCWYGPDPARAQRPDPTVLILELETAHDSLRVVGAAVEHAGYADEYQQRCVTGWFEKVVVETPGVTEGKRFRVRYPVKL